MLFKMAGHQTNGGITMDSERKIQQRTVESRKKLLQAAYEIFTQEGYYNTNTKEIVKRAGISTGSFYNYYKDKGDIYCALLEEYAEGSAAAMKELLDRLKQAEDRASCRQYLFAWLAPLLERSVKSRKFFEDAVVISRENERVGSLLSGLEEKVIMQLTGYLQSRGTGNAEEYPVHARMIYVITEHIAGDICRVTDAGQKEVYIRLFVDEILHHIYE